MKAEYIGKTRLTKRGPGIVAALRILWNALRGFEVCRWVPVLLIVAVLIGGCGVMANPQYTAVIHQSVSYSDDGLVRWNSLDANQRLSVVTDLNRVLHDIENGLAGKPAPAGR